MSVARSKQEHSALTTGHYLSKPQSKHRHPTPACASHQTVFITIGRGASALLHAAIPKLMCRECTGPTAACAKVSWRQQLSNRSTTHNSKAVRRGRRW